MKRLTMLWSGDIYMFAFCVIVALVAAYYFYRFTEKKVQSQLSYLFFCLTIFVFCAHLYFYSHCTNEDHYEWSKNTLDEHIPPPLPSMVYDKPDIMKAPRSDVMILTPWLAPVVWNRTFNRDILNKQFEGKNDIIGLSVFALGSYWKLLKKFLDSADTFFMVGHKVNYYVYTDQPNKVQCISAQRHRKCEVIETQSYTSKERIFMSRMESLSRDIKSKLINVQYLVCADVDIVFHDTVGVEILGDLVATLHPGYYKSNRQDLTYERRTASQAYIPEGKGDFYYQANFFAGAIQEIYYLTKSCDENIKIDYSNGIIAVFHDESHFNKYLLYHKPTKVLSPEYIWSRSIRQPSDVQTIRIVHGDKATH